MTQITEARQARTQSSVLRRFLTFIAWIFPFVLAAIAYLLGLYYEPASALTAPLLVWPVPEGVYLWLLLLVLAAIAWLVFEFISVSGRETIVSALQMDVTVSTLTAIFFTGFGGWLLGTGQLQWWFVVPWAATIIDAVTAGWLSVNNAAQKPFLSQKGSK
ncbi:MAG: hypothetical protein ACR2OW_09185 [Methyloligellaceae bacterium]